MSRDKRIDPALTMQPATAPLSSATLDAARVLPTPPLPEAAGKIGALPWQIKPMAPSFRLSGPALTVHSPPGDNLWLHRALYAAQPGDIMVVYCGGKFDHG